MAAAPDLSPVLAFLDELRLNNTKAWFDTHRPAYAAARAAFEQFVNGLIDEFRGTDRLEGLSAKDCIPRIYRDMRFSKDKSPYKTNLAALIAPGGWKDFRSGYYVSIEPHGHSLTAGGLYDPTPAQLAAFRQAIDRNAAPFKRVLGAARFVEAFGELEGERLKTAPKGYDREHPEIALLQLKSITAVHHFSDSEVLKADLTGKVIGVCQAMRPFLDSLDEMVQ